MSFMEWNQDLYSVGIVKMDEQHKQLVALINALHVNKGKNDSAFVEKILNTLIQYTLNHFRDEEKIMKKINFLIVKAIRSCTRSLSNQSLRPRKTLKSTRIQ